MYGITETDYLAETRRLLPTVPTWLITGFRRDADGHPQPLVADVLAQAVELGAAGVAWDRQGPIDAGSVALVREAGLTLNVWTVDEAEDAVRLVALGVDTITSNRAAWLRGAVAAAGVNT